MDLDWKRLFRLQIEDRQVFGLDIGSSSVNAVQLRKKGNSWVVTAANRIQIAPNQEDDSQTNTVSAINQCLESSGFQTRMAVCGVSGPEVAIRDFKFPSMPPDEMGLAVMFEATQVCPFNADDAAVDYQLMGNDKDNVSGILVAATNMLIRNKIELAKQSSVDCVLMDADGLALLNCLSECEKDGEGQTTAVLNIGSTYTTLAIMNGRGTPTSPFVRDVAYAGNDIVEAISKDNDKPTEIIKETLLGGTNSAKESAVSEASLEKACEKLIVDVTETLRYYTAQPESSIVERIFVCGCFAIVQGLVELLDKQLPAKVSLWNPFEKIKYVAGQHCENILQKEGPAMAIATGLAMRLI
jgi:type IV pilus assembly protein PilM